MCNSNNAEWCNACNEYCTKYGYVLVNIYQDYFEYKTPDGVMHVMYAKELADSLFR